MKAGWVGSPDSNLWPPWQALRDAGVNRVYYAAMKEVIEQSGLRAEKRTADAKVWVPNHQCTSEYRLASLTQIPQYGIYRDLHWGAGTGTVGEGVRNVKDDLERSGMAHNGPYFVDAEFPYRDGNMLLALFSGIRALFPDLLLAWTMEPMQGGWIKSFPALVKFVNHDKNMVVVGQTFGGNMEPYGVDRVRADLRLAGFLAARIRLVYDAAKPRPPKWDGCLFTTEALVV